MRISMITVLQGNERRRQAKDGWNARLYYTGEKDGKAVYCFEFLNWKVKDGLIVQGGMYMNMLVVAIEKMFLDIDPNTQVTDKRVDIKTKYRFY